MIEYLQGETDTGFVEAVGKLIANYSQPEVLKYVIEALMKEPEEGCLIRGEKNRIEFMDTLYQRLLKNALMNW